MNRFYVTLPSNSSTDYYPENTVARYTTKLADKIELESEWEVGLAEISFPSEVENVVYGHCYFDLYINDVHMRRVTLPSGHHKRVRSLIDTIHREQRSQIPLQSHEPLLVELSYVRGKISLKLHENPNAYIAIEFSRDLARMLGLDEYVKYRRNTTAKRSTSLTAGDVTSAYVYCDILEHVAVGDTKAPLLRIVDKPKKTYGNVHQTLNPILYVPLQKKNFDTVEINIMTDTGVPVPFRYGKAFVVLEFRRAIHAYLGL